MAYKVIPFVDLRGKTPIDMLRSYPDRARDMLRDSRRVYGALSEYGSLAALPVADRISRFWLKKRRNPYLYEIESSAEMLHMSGVYSLNMSFEWGCTTGVWRTAEGSNTMLRVLDWPFPSLGKYAMVALQSGPAGTFYNITWPGLAGSFTAMAPGRFSVAVNLAPMRMHGLGLAGDWIKNRFLQMRAQGLPPAHLLRKVCEQAKTYQEAHDMLMKTPLAVPAIFTLCGTGPGEGVIMERLEDTAAPIELGAGIQISAANHFTSLLNDVGKGWRPREIDSVGRFRQSCNITAHDLEQDHFRWLTAPIINERTRLCVIADAATGRLQVQGYEGLMPVTEIFYTKQQSIADEPVRQVF